MDVARAMHCRVLLLHDTVDTLSPFFPSIFGTADRPSIGLKYKIEPGSDSAINCFYGCGTLSLVSVVDAVEFVIDTFVIAFDGGVVTKCFCNSALTIQSIMFYRTRVRLLTNNRTYQNKLWPKIFAQR